MDEKQIKEWDVICDFIPWTGFAGMHDYYPPGVTEATRVEIIFRNGMRQSGVAQSFGWNHSGYHPEVHITHYRVLD